MKKIFILLISLYTLSICAQVTIENIAFDGIVPAESNSIIFEFDKNLLPTLRPNSRQRPGFEYYWNFGDGNFCLTNRYLGSVEHTYKTIDSLNVNVQVTPIKTDDDDILAAFQEVVVNNTKANRKNKIWNIKKDAIELMEVRQAVPGKPITIIGGYKSPNTDIIDSARITLRYNINDFDTISLDDFNPVYLNGVNIDTIPEAEVYYDDNFKSIDTLTIDGEQNRIFYFDVFNLNLKQRNLFINIKINENVKVGKRLMIYAKMDILDSGSSINSYQDQDTLILNTADSHDPSYKIIECVNDTVAFNELDSLFQAMDTSCDALNTIFTPLDATFTLDSINNPLHFNCNIIDSTFTSLDPTFINSNYTFKLVDMLIHMQNDGKGATDSIFVIDRPSVPLANAYWCPQKTWLHQTDGDTTLYLLDSMRFDFPDIELRGTMEDGYITEFPDTATIDEIKFAGLVIVPNESTLICNEADIYFDDNLPETVRSCIWIYCSECNEIQQVTETILPPDTCILRGDSITITSLPSSLATSTYQWLPTGETTTSITVNPIVTTTYTLGISKCDADGIERYIIDDITVQVKDTCDINTIVIDTTPITCKGENNGSIQLSFIDGTPPFTVQWDDIGENLTYRDNLTAGLYIVKTTDAEQCSRTDSILIKESLPLWIDHQITSNPEGTYNIITSTSGGTFPYTYQWQTGEATQNLNNIPLGIYILTIMDDRGCTFSKEIIIDGQIPTLSQWSLCILFMLFLTIVANQLITINTDINARKIALPILGTYLLEPSTYKRTLKKMWIIPILCTIFILLIFKEFLLIDLLGITIFTLIITYWVHLLDLNYALKKE